MNENKLQFKNPIVFFNPKSAGGKTAKKYTQISNTLSAPDFGFDKVTFVETKKERNENNATIAKELQKEQYDLIITIGGDGTISSIVNAMLILEKKYHRPIMPIPFGSGNSVLREFGIFNITDALANYKKSTQTKFFDVLSVVNESTGFKYFCINIIGMGFICDAVQEVLKFNKKYGSFSYILGIIKALKYFPKYKVKLELQTGLTKKVLSFDKTHYISLSNTKFTGGGILIAPQAKYNDGLMDIVLLHDLTRVSFLNGFLKTFKGEHLKRKGCEYQQAEKATVYAEPNFSLMPDGELEGSSPISISVLKSEVEMIL